MRLLPILFLSIFCAALNAQTFSVVEGSFTWQEAKADAEARGGRLAVLSTQSKLDAAESAINSFEGGLWIGLTDEASEGQWLWINGVELTFSNWAPGQPSNSLQSGVRENYASIYWKSKNGNREWNDVVYNDSNIGPGTGNQNNLKGYLYEEPINYTPSDRVGTIEVSYFDADTSTNPAYHYFKTSSVLYFLDFEEGSLNDYVWDSTTERLVDNTFGEYIDYTFTSENKGTFILYDEDGTNTGTFVSYDANWDLDYDGTADGAQIEAGNLLGAGVTHPINLQSDADGDGLTLAQEGAYGTDPNDNDSDDDELLDGAEVNTYFTNPNLADSDADGLSDNAEIATYSSDPILADTSGDGLNDGAVVSAGFTPTVDYSPLFSVFIQDARAGNSFIERAGDQARLQLQIERSNDLESWSSDNSDLIQVDLPMTGNYNFFRFTIPSAEVEHGDEQ